VCGSWLHEALFRERHKLCVIVGDMKLCVDRDMLLCDSWLYEAVCR